jgi:hypothetical protein
MRHAAAVFGFVVLASAGGSAWAEIYRWTDDDGTVHYTQSLEQRAGRCGFPCAVRAP